MSDSNTYRYPAERNELVERLIVSEKRCKLLERTLTEYAEHVGDERSDGSYAVALQARVAQLEANMERLLQRKRSA